MDSQDRWDHEAFREIERKIALALKGIRYGSVEVLIHDSKVVQIERKEKLRLESAPHQR
ncbi:MAG: YezD family protein [Nitrospiraceae bacterium]